MSSVKKGEGAGTKGGVIVGYTAGGKPIYQSKQRKDSARGGKTSGKKKNISKLKRIAEKLKRQAVKKSEDEMEKSIQTLVQKLKETSNSITEEQINEVIAKAKAGEITIDEMKKALTAGYDNATELSQTEIKAEVHNEEEAAVNNEITETNETVEASTEVSEEVVAETTETVEASSENAEPAAEASEEVVEETKKAPKFDSGLFGEFSLGATIVNSRSGQASIEGMQKNKFDYVEAAKFSNKKNNDK